MSCLIITMSPLTTSTLALCLLVCLLVCLAMGEQPGAGHLLPRAVLGQGEARQPG